MGLNGDLDGNEKMAINTIKIVLEEERSLEQNSECPFKTFI